MLLAAEDHFPDLRRQVLGQVARQSRGLFLLLLDLAACLRQALALLVHVVGGDGDAQAAEQDGHQRHQRRGGGLELRLDQAAEQQHGAGRSEQRDAEEAQAAAEQGGEAEHHQQHQAGHYREAHHHGAGAGMQGVDEQQGEAHLLWVVAAEAQLDLVRQVRVEQGVGHQPEDVVAEELRVGAGRDGRGRGQVGQHARVVDAQRRGGQTVGRRGAG
ncbi:hypothetical protein D9M69_453560 [compost metagenome]